MKKLIFSAVLGPALLAVPAASFAADLAQNKDVICAAFYDNAAHLQSLHGNKSMAAKQSQYAKRVDLLKVTVGTTSEALSEAMTRAKKTDFSAFDAQLGAFNAKDHDASRAEVGGVFAKFVKEREVKLGCSQV